MTSETVEKDFFLTYFRQQRKIKVNSSWITTTWLHRHIGYFGRWLWLIKTNLTCSYYLESDAESMIITKVCENESVPWECETFQITLKSCTFRLKFNERFLKKKIIFSFNLALEERFDLLNYIIVNFHDYSLKSSGNLKIIKQKKIKCGWYFLLRLRVLLINDLFIFWIRSKKSLNTIQFLNITLTKSQSLK